MDYLGIVLLGYMVNLTLFVLLLVTSIVLSILGVVLSPNKANTIDEMKYVEQTMAELKEIKELLPIGKRLVGLDVAIFFPFMFSLVVLNFLWNVFRFGFFGGIAHELQKKLAILEYRAKEMMEDQ